MGIIHLMHIHHEGKSHIKIYHQALRLPRVSIIPRLLHNHIAFICHGRSIILATNSVFKQNNSLCFSLSLSLSLSLSISIYLQTQTISFSQRLRVSNIPMNI
jgi:hypothetical protein